MGLWPPRSPDLKPCGIYDQMCKSNPRTEDKFTALKVRRLCPPILIKIIWKGGWTLESEDGSVLVALGCQYAAEGRRWVFWLSFVFGGKRYNEILFTLGRRRFDENFKLILEMVVWEACSATSSFGIASAFAVEPRKTTENLDRVDRSFVQRSTSNIIH